MSFVGNTKGPRKSEIVQNLGPDNFGISMEQLNVEIQLYRDFIKFNAPNRNVQRSYLEGRINGIFKEG